MSNDVSFAEAVAVANKTSTEIPTAQLRWRGAVLQQKWRVIEFEGWQEVAERSEWRDVPVDDKEG